MTALKYVFVTLRLYDSIDICIFWLILVVYYLFCNGYLWYFCSFLPYLANLNFFPICLWYLKYQRSYQVQHFAYFVVWQGAHFLFTDGQYAIFKVSKATFTTKKKNVVWVVFFCIFFWKSINFENFTILRHSCKYNRSSA